MKLRNFYQNAWHESEKQKGKSLSSFNIPQKFESLFGAKYPTTHKICLQVWIIVEEQWSSTLSYTVNYYTTICIHTWIQPQML